MILDKIMNKLADLQSSKRNMFFLGIMIVGSMFIMGSLYVIYDTQLFGVKSFGKIDAMAISFIFASIHVVLTNMARLVYKKNTQHKNIT